MKAERAIRVLLVASRSGDRPGLAGLLRRAGARVLIRTRDAGASLDAVIARGRRPDVVVFDPGPEGPLPIPLLFEHSAAVEATPCVILLDDADSEAAAQAVRAGARAVLSRDARAAEIVAAVQ
ncbi:MAG TPA: hypothetical protein VH137_08745, partial [Gemmatimonadales bacterium]|nr:hypothetical protein [Gemmatimonadales bacterium]